MSSVSGVGVTSYPPVVNDLKKPVAKQPSQPQIPAVQTVAKDTDGDNDSRLGRNLDVRA